MKNSDKKKRGKSPKTQTQIFALQLKRLRVNVTTDDRRRFVDKYGASLATVSRYLNGAVANTVLAAKMVSFFSKAIAKREKLLSN